MSKSLKLVILNSKKHQIQQIQPIKLTTPLPKKHSHQINLSDKINQLQGNLKMLQKKYRSNLKQGFDNKINSYRLQAVVERKMLKEVIEQTQKAHEMQHIRQKIESNEYDRKLGASKAEMAQFQRQQRLKYIKLRNLRQRRGISLTLHQRRQQLDRQVRDAHDKIIQQQSHINKKRDYFEFIRKATLKKQELLNKKEILNNIMNNTERLKSLKYALNQLRSSEKQGTFITI